MKQREKGFTLAEVVIGAAIMALVVGAIGAATTTILLNSGQAAEQYVVLPQIQNASYWISRDVRMASGIHPGETNGFPLSLDIPVDEDPDHDYGIEYLFVGNKLMREVYDSSGETLVSETFIADCIDTDNTKFSTVDATAGHYKLTIAAAVAGATKSYEINQRISLDYRY